MILLSQFSLVLLLIFHNNISYNKSLSVNNNAIIYVLLELSICFTIQNHYTWLHCLRFELSIVISI